MKFAIFGGSFNPVHNGHLKLAVTTLAQGYDRVILVPAYQSPLKPEGQAKNAEIRLEMLLAAINGDHRFTVDACEIKRKGISYTVDTVRDIIQRYTPEGKIGLVLGDDLVSNYSQWRGADEIAKCADIILARRNYSHIEFPYPHLEMHNEIFELSSAEIRQAAASGANWQDKVPPAVRDIIAEKKLYLPDSALCESPGLPPADGGLESYARSRLPLARFVHSRNVALHSADLALRFGEDSKAAYTAGIVHDICKELTDTEILDLVKHDAKPLSAVEKAKPSLLHGRAAAVFIQNQFHIQDERILEAVRCHTLGAENAGNLAKIVYLADKIEVGRNSVEYRLRQLAFGPNPCKNLAELYQIIYDATQKWLEDRGIKQHTNTN